MKKSCFFTAISVLLFSSFNAPQASDYLSPRTLALGGSGHAGPLLNDAIYLNPGFTSLIKTYSASLSYLRYSEGENYHGHNYNLSIQDAQTELFQAGLGYSSREEGALISVGASKSIMENLAVGLGGKLFLGRDKRTTNDITLGIAQIPVTWLQLSLTIDNILESASGKARNFYREFTLGTKFNIMNIVLVYVDPHFTPSLDSKSFGYELGLEFGVMSDLFLRVGRFSNSSIPYQQGIHGSGWGAGAGLILGRFSLDYGFSHITENSNQLHRVNTHTLGGTLFL